MDFLTVDWLGKPVWMWSGFIALVLALLAFDLGLLHRKSREIGVRESLFLSAFYIALGLAFGGWVWWQLGAASGIAYVTGFVVEKTLALDNVFVIAMIFAFFAVPRAHQHRVLLWGILGVIVLRAVMIGFGAALVANFSWVLYVFAVFLIATGVKMLFVGDKETSLADNRLLKFLRRHLNVSDEHHGSRFVVRKPDPETGGTTLYATPLLLSLIMIEFADVVFAVDSVPAIFAITPDPFIVYTSNIFAILGLRALYFALAAMLHRFRYLKTSLAVVLVFIGAKIFLADILGTDKIPPVLSLAVTSAILASGIIYSLWRTRRDQPDFVKAARN